MPGAARSVLVTCILSVLLAPVCDARTGSITIGSVSLRGSAAVAYTTVRHDTSLSGRGDWHLRPRSAYGAFDLRATWRPSRMVETTLQVLGRSRSGFPWNSSAGSAGSDYAGDAEPTGRNHVDIGDAYMRFRPVADGAVVTVGRFALPFGVLEAHSDNGATHGRPFAIHPVLFDALAGNSVGLRRDIGVRVDVPVGSLVSTLAVMRGLLAAANGQGHVDEATTAVVRIGKQRTHTRPLGYAFSGIYSADTEPRVDGPDIALYGAQADMWTSPRGHVDCSLGFAALRYADSEEETFDDVLSFWVGVAVPLRKLRVSGQYSVWWPFGAGGDDELSAGIPVVGYSLYRDPSWWRDARAEERVYRVQFSASYPVTPDIDLRAELLADFFPRGTERESYYDSRRTLRYRYRETSMRTVGGIVGLTAAI